MAKPPNRVPQGLAFETWVPTNPSRASMQLRPDRPKLYACHNPHRALRLLPMNLRPTTGRFTYGYWYPQRPGGLVRFKTRFSDHP
jgi:hypothetical protein